jgi:hypothetical protein
MIHGGLGQGLDETSGKLMAPLSFLAYQCQHIVPSSGLATVSSPSSPPYLILMTQEPSITTS